MLLVAMAALFLAGCSTTKDLGKDAEECLFQEMPSSLYTRDGDIEIYISTKCNSDFMTFYNNSQEAGFQCEAVYNFQKEEFYLAPEESKEIEFEADFDPDIDHFCLQNDIKPLNIAEDIRWKMVDSINYFSFKNLSEVTQVCRFYDADDGSETKNIVIDPEAWTPWIKISSGDYNRECETYEPDVNYQTVSDSSL